MSPMMRQAPQSSSISVQPLLLERERLQLALSKITPHYHHRFEPHSLIIIEVCECDSTSQCALRSNTHFLLIHSFIDHLFFFASVKTSAPPFNFSLRRSSLSVVFVCILWANHECHLRRAQASQRWMMRQQPARKSGRNSRLAFLFFRFQVLLFLPQRFRWQAWFTVVNWR